MRADEFKTLNAGQILRHASGIAYVVVGRCPGGGLVLARTIAAYNPDEWTLAGSGLYPEFFDAKNATPTPPPPPSGAPWSSGGFFPPGERKQIEWAEFEREKTRSGSLGLVNVWDQNVSEDAPIGTLPEGAATEYEAVCFLWGYRLGHIRGHEDGAQEVKRDLRKLVGL